MIPAGMRKNVPVQWNREITGEFFLRSMKKLFPAVVYYIKKKLGCIFVENHNWESMILRGQTLGLVTSCVSEARKARSNGGRD